MILTNQQTILLNNWLQALQIQNFSGHSLQAYQSALHHFCHFLNTHDNRNNTSSMDMHANGFDLKRCDRRLFSYFIAQRIDTDALSSKSVQLEISAIRSFYAWLIDTKQAIINPTSGYKLKSTPRALPKIADIDLLTQLLDQPIPKGNNQARLWLRDKSMFELLYGSGLRVQELVNIDVNDIDMQQKKVRIIGKGNKTRIVPISSKAVASINAYLAVRYQWVKNADMALFITEIRGTRIGVRSVQKRLKYWANQAGISHNLYPHLLRHCFASHMLSDSGDLRAVQEMLGHSDIATTQIYTQVDFGKLSQVYDKSHPRAAIDKTE